MAERRMKGATMQKVFGVVLAAVLLSTNNGGGVLISDEIGESDEFVTDDISYTVSDRETIDIATLLTAARGAPPVICSLASQAVRNGGWGWSDAPVTPLGKTYLMRDDDRNSRTTHVFASWVSASLVDRETRQSRVGSSSVCPTHPARFARSLRLDWGWVSRRKLSIRSSGRCAIPKSECGRIPRGLLVTSSRAVHSSR
jgi:hypothetical protein